MSILVGGIICSILCCHMELVLAFMRLYSIFNLRLLLSILFYIIIFYSGTETPDRNGQWYQHHLTVFYCYRQRSNLRAKGSVL